MTPEQKLIRKLRFQLSEMVNQADALTAAIDGVTDQFDHLKDRLDKAARAAEALLQEGRT